MKKLIVIFIILALMLAGAGLFLESQQQNQGDTPDEQNNGQPVDTTNWSTFHNSNYDFSLRYPADDFSIEAATSNQPTPRFNFYTSSAEGSLDLPLDHFADATHISVYPEGIPTEGFFGQTAGEVDLETAFELSEDSKVYILEDGTPFAALVKPADPPRSWTESGFIWVRVVVEDTESRCERDGETISQQECDPLVTDDQIFHSGDVDAEMWATLEAILENIEFAEGSTTGDLIELESPQAGEVIESPLTISGQARGPWYFEASFSAVLTDWDGRIIAEGPVQAQGPWMTEEFVDFSGTLEFDSPYPDGGEDFMKWGHLILQKANPSGLPENADALEIRVRFAE